MIATLQDPQPNAVDNLFERSILDLGIPPWPSILDRFMTEARKAEPNYQRLALIIAADVSLSAGLIKTANSPYFGARQRVRSTNEALSVLGLNVASRAIAGIILRKSFPHLANLERFWDASARIARLSGWLALQLNIKGVHAEDAYTYGLFRDCGIPVLLGRLPNYASVLAKANMETSKSFTAVEEEVFPTNHSMVGCVLAQSWWLPEEICLAIRNHHDQKNLGSANVNLPMLSRRLIAVSQLAEHIIQQQLGFSITQEWGKLGEICLRILEISPEQLTQLLIDAAPIAAANE
jgi:HD-like signal output (HDOD) protein